MASSWYIKKDQGEIGPKVFSELVELVRSDSLTETDLVRSEWNTEWQRADKIVGLFYMARKSIDIPTVDSLPSGSVVNSLVDPIEKRSIDLGVIPQPVGWIHWLLYLIGLKRPLPPIVALRSDEIDSESLSTETATDDPAIVRPALSLPTLDRKAATFSQSPVVFVPGASRPIINQATHSTNSAEVASDVAITGTPAPAFGPSVSRIVTPAAPFEMWASSIETSASGLTGAINAAMDSVTARSEKTSRPGLAGRFAGVDRLLGRLPIRAVFRVVVVLLCASLALKTVNSWSTVRAEQAERNSSIIQRQLSRGLRNGRSPELVAAFRRNPPVPQHYFPLVGYCGRMEYLALMETLAVIVAVAAYQGAKLVDSSVLAQVDSRRKAFT